MRIDRLDVGPMRERVVYDFRGLRHRWLRFAIAGGIGRQAQEGIRVLRLGRIDGGGCARGDVVQRVKGPPSRETSRSYDTTPEATAPGSSPVAVTIRSVPTGDWTRELTRLIGRVASSSHENVEAPNPVNPEASETCEPSIVTL